MRKPKSQVDELIYEAIETKNEERSNKFGRKISIAKWILNDKENALKMYNEA